MSDIHSSKKKTALLLILDGWGHREETSSNAIHSANSPMWDSLWAGKPHTLIDTSGKSVGLPAGQMGNSEVGHMNLGAGRVVYQSLTRIDKDIKHRPAVLVGTPGRVADHLRREAFENADIKTLVLDEFDKSLEVGFENEMREILELLPRVNKKILTSATQGVAIPRFVELTNPVTIDYLDEEISQLAVKMVIAPSKDKLDTLLELIAHLENQNGIIFCNFKDSIQRVSEYLSEHNLSHGTFYGGMEQGERERTLIKFRNGTHQVLLATDLAARGIDVPEINFIIHYHLPNKSEEFTHRNGRTARMNSNGTAYVLHCEQENLPDFIGDLPVEQLTKKPLQERADWSTLFISGGRKDKISKGDIAGLFFKQGNLSKGELGVIELKNDCAFVSVKTDTIKDLLPKVNNTRLKKKKVRITVA
ncbi:MAG: DbpA RNA binding domain-containing protein [Bacteroidetes bacterium]|nr:DbpA RNA binding domain-containing protein [Bacteroidota bacterium]